MSSGYRRDFVPRGGGGYTRGRGRGGFKQRPRYWDNDDYYDRDKVSRNHMLISKIKCIILTL